MMRHYVIEVRIPGNAPSMHAKTKREVMRAARALMAKLPRKAQAVVFSDDFFKGQEDLGGFTGGKQEGH